MTHRVRDPRVEELLAEQAIFGLTEEERRRWPGPGRPQTLLRLADEQGMPIFLVAATGP